MKTLAVFAEQLYGGGVEKVLQTLLGSLDTGNYAVTLYSIRREELKQGYSRCVAYKPLFCTLSDGDNAFTRLLKKLRNKARLCIYYHFPPSVFYRLFVRKRFDVGIAFIEGYATRILSGAPSGMRKLAWVHTDLERNHWTTVAFRSDDEEKGCYRSFDKVVCVSEVIREIMDRGYGLVGKTAVLRNPIDREGILSSAKDSLPSRFAKAGRMRMLTIGSLIHVKGYDRLLRCARRLTLEGFDFELYIVGAGYLEAELKKYVDENDMGGYVTFTGFQSNPYPLLQSADIYVCSSIAEGINTSVTEAVILGKPVISTECSGVRELLGDSEYGLVVGNDEEALLEGLRCMLEDDKLREKYSAAAFEKGKCFSIEAPMEGLYDLIA